MRRLRRAWQPQGAWPPAKGMRTLRGMRRLAMKHVGQLGLYAMMVFAAISVRAASFEVGIYTEGHPWPQAARTRSS